MKTVIEMAHEAAGDDWGLFQEFMPEIHRLVELVRADERSRMAEQPAQRQPLSEEEILTYRHMIDWTAEWSYINFARSIEAAHGIKENT